ncbi:quinol monooxygenase YgiN [Sinomonas sp. RB5]
MDESYQLGRLATMTDPVRLKATFIPNEGEFFRVKLALDIAIEEVQREPGCLQYEITDESEDRFVLSELWASEEDLERHSKGVAVQDLNESLSALLAEPITIERL